MLCPEVTAIFTQLGFPLLPRLSWHAHRGGAGHPQPVTGAEVHTDVGKPLCAVSESEWTLTADIRGCRVASGVGGLLPIRYCCAHIENLFHRGWSVLVKTLILVSTLHLRNLSSSLGAEPNCLFWVKESCVETCQIYSHGDPSHSHCRQVLWAAAQFPCP